MNILQLFFNMKNLQLADSSFSGVSRTAPLKFMDLPKEIRLMIYHYALRKRTTKPSFPALLSVNRQIREEASPTFYRQNRFLLKLQPQPTTRSTVLDLDGKTREWLALIGPGHVNNLRRVALSFIYHLEYTEYHIDLACRDAGNWKFTNKRGPYQPFRSLQGDVEMSEDHTHYSEISDFLVLLGFPIDDAILNHYKTNAIKRYATALRRAQRAMDQFSDSCGESKSVKPTLEGLEVIARALAAVEEACFHHSY
ncbi:hypothetical protein QM012_002178 [Aureobasidium pullulans]|uniref:2EXR domain-containing protein n=1 Tax=Aureobasidium pullulans TaxID=5580 RepID=A0ABR0TB68_AURPU